MTSNDVQTADIILTSRPLNSSPISGAIKVGTASKYSHAMIVVDSTMIVEAVGEIGVTKRMLSLAINGCDLVTVYRHAEMTAAKAQRIVQFVESKLGGEYASPGVLSGSGLATAILPSIIIPMSIGRAAINAYRESQGKKRSYFCSELVAAAYLDVGLPLGRYGRMPSMMNPGDIDEYSEREPEVLEKLGSLS